MSLKVYYLDDELTLCESFVETFSSAKVAVTSFSDPKKAIEAAESNPPDLFFIDYRLPGITGDKVAEALAPEIPKFLVTGDIFIETNVHFIKVISKPFTDDEILEIIHKYS